MADLAEAGTAGPPPVLPASTPAPDIAGASPCFRNALEELTQIMQSPYGLVTGERGVGKMFFIRALWRQEAERIPA